MPNLIVLGSQWGDEGKGKIVDILSRDADLVVRYQGGSNAGHTVVTRKGTYIFHLMCGDCISMINKPIWNFYFINHTIRTCAL